MPNWIAKAVVQKGISFLPWKHKVNHLFQKYVTKGVLLNEEHLHWKLTHAKDHLQFFREEQGKPFGESNCLELGTGWYPVVPIALYLNGFSKVYSLDIRPWMNGETMLVCIEMLREWRETGRLEKYLSDFDEDRWNALLKLADDKAPMEKICETIGLELLIKDARDTGLDAGSIDYFTSNNTFEHIYAEVLLGILAEFKRIKHDRSVMSHFIDLSDHFAHMDSSINIYNFLQFSEKRWKLIDNDIQPQNRLRWKDYLVMYEQLDLPYREALVREGSVEAVERIAIDAHFKNYSSAELAISHGYLISNFYETSKR
ncbi:MAG: class I SAM-dependent methyltransferase [Bacteroidetes bacterium]|nr:class I SAM-dependent methyltransferase [Bacteroidota bacterium]